MNRRTSIKNMAFLGVLGLQSVTVSSCINRSSRPVNPENLAQYKDLISEVAEVIIPRTDTPGAKDVQVADFIILYQRDCASKKEQRNFAKGLSDLKQYSWEKYRCEFSGCSGLEKAQVLAHFARQSRVDQGWLGKVKNRLFGKPFFTQIHALTVEGYCSSHLGATMALAYDPVPGTYKGCFPMQANQRSWAT